MKLFVLTFSDNSYRVVISADNINSAWGKAKKYIKDNHSWYNMDMNKYDMRVDTCDEDYVIT